MKMKRVVCEKCGKALKHLIPADATDVICFKCDNTPQRGKK